MMTFAQVVETSLTNNSSSQNHLHPDDHTIRTADTPGFKPFTIVDHRRYVHRAFSVAWGGVGHGKGFGNEANI